MQTHVGDVLIQLVEGDITAQDDLDVIVNAANAELRIGGGVAGAIHEAAGPDLEEACQPLAPIQPGQAVITDAFNLPNRAVIHCLGPVFGRDNPADALLAACYRHALDLADQKQFNSVGFPSISTGAFGYPMKDAAEVAFAAVREQARELEYVRLIRFVLFDQHALSVHAEALQDQIGL